MGLTSKKTSNNLVITSVAFQDHISRSLLDSNGSFCETEALRCHKNPAASTRNQNRVTRRVHTQPEEQREYVVDEAPPRLTLAQKLGLVPGPALRLTVDEWSAVKTRCVRQGDSALPCVICRAEFGLHPQVLLSCSHVFHRACLQVYERFSGRKCCPMCRKEQYETRVIHDAANIFRQQSATRIQACWRGYMARRWYVQILKTTPPEERDLQTTPPKDKDLRRKFFEAKLQELSDSLVRCCRTDVDAFLSDIDHSLSASRSLFQQLERVSEPGKPDWDRILNQVIHRDVQDCPICLTSVSSSGFGTGARRAVLLSCSHLFHQTCLDAFEAFREDRAATCPLCRSAYCRKNV